MTHTSSNELLQLGAADEGAPVCDHSLLVKLTSKVMSSQYPDLSPHCPASQRRSTHPPLGPVTLPHWLLQRSWGLSRAPVAASLQGWLPYVTRVFFSRLTDMNLIWEDEKNKSQKIFLSLSRSCHLTIPSSPDNPMVTRQSHRYLIIPSSQVCWPV